jgi:hypothetical protein
MSVAKTVRFATERRFALPGRVPVHEDERSGEGGDGNVVAALAPYAPLGRGER